MNVTPLSSAETVRCSKPEINCPPFIVVGLASESFLARIDLIFNSVDDSDNLEGQPFSLEHWVDVCDKLSSRKSFFDPFSLSLIRFDVPLL